jgi:hypothetical protein
VEVELVLLVLLVDEVEPVLIHNSAEKKYFNILFLTGRCCNRGCGGGYR